MTAPPMMIDTLAQLRALYDPARERSVHKEMTQLDVHATRFIGLSPLLVVSSANAAGAMDAPLASALFWGSMGVALAIAGVPPWAALSAGLVAAPPFATTFCPPKPVRTNDTSFVERR